MIYLTVDDVPSARCAEKLAWLKKQGIPAVLFVWGEKARGNEKLLISAIQQGFRIGNHSWSHRHFSELNEDEVRSEISQTHDLIASLYAQAALPWEQRLFRFPYLDPGRPDGQAQWIQGLLRDAGYQAPAIQAGNFLDTRCGFDQKEYFYQDPAAPDGLDQAPAILARIGPGSPAAGAIVLIHDHEYSHDLFFQCIERYRSQGASFGLP